MNCSGCEGNGRHRCGKNVYGSMFNCDCSCYSIERYSNERVRKAIALSLLEEVQRMPLLDLTITGEAIAQWYLDHAIELLKRPQ